MGDPRSDASARITALEAAAALAAEHRVRFKDLVILKDGSNLSVHLAPAPVVPRVATFTARIRREPLIWLQREVDLVTWLAAAGASVMAPSDLVPVGPHAVGGWAITAWRYVDHRPGIVPDGQATLQALDELHDVLHGYPGGLPLLNPAADDLDRAIAFGLGQQLLSATQAEDLRARRDTVFAELAAIAPDRQALHGDAFPRNSLVTDHGVVWIDFEDCCSGPVVWDHATLLRRIDDDATGNRAAAATIRARHGDDAVRAALVLRGLQEEVWNLLHDARRAGLIRNLPA
ncbi:MAG TPA: phosphotransferase [Candidatus Bathyarchaeia archaeon]|nr:phosphotransferase [Candidatus Bathyarchaeia archaeon]